MHAINEAYNRMKNNQRKVKRRKPSFEKSHKEILTTNEENEIPEDNIAKRKGRS